jgi:hypothetical protein
MGVTGEANYFAGYDVFRYLFFLDHGNGFRGEILISNVTCRIM